jgi:putative drug exporter of the RND superfamily
MSVTTRPTSRFVRLARVCNRHRWRTFLAWLLALAVIKIVAQSDGVKQISSFRLPGTESQRAYDLLAEHFPAAKGDTDQLVYKAKSGTLNDAANRARIEASLKKVRTDHNVASVASPFGEGGRLTKDGKIGVATLNYKESTNDIDPKDLEKVQNAAFTARTSRSSTAARAPRSCASRTATARRRASASSPPRSCCSSRSAPWSPPGCR